MEDEQDLIHVNMDGKNVCIYENIEVFNQHSDSTVNDNLSMNNEVSSTMENKDDTENKDMDLISMIKNVVLDERVGDKNIIKQLY